MTNRERANALEVEAIDGEWWIVNHFPSVQPPTGGADPADNIGPYDTKRDALYDLKGIKAFYQYVCDEEPEDKALFDLLNT